jgi:hypothetical protein
MQRKMFTVDEANSLLPDVRRAVTALQDRMRWLAAHRPAVPYLIPEFKVPQDALVPEDYFAGLLQVRKTLGEVDAIGCQIKDIQMGLVDFPSRLFGREILLCWRLGEDLVGYYHDPEAGYSGRRPLPPDLGGRGGDPQEGSSGSA